MLKVTNFTKTAIVWSTKTGLLGDPGSSRGRCGATATSGQFLRPPISTNAEPAFSSLFLFGVLCQSVFVEIKQKTVH